MLAVALAGFGALSGFGVVGTASAQDEVAGNLIEFNDNGAWSWFEDERAIVDVSAGKILVGSVADGRGVGGMERNGDIEIVEYDIATGERHLFTLKSDYEVDDHDSPAIWLRPDGKYATTYAGHGKDNYTYHRVSLRPGDATEWTDEQAFDAGAGVTYNNLHYLPAEDDGKGRLYNFTRTRNWDPNVMVSGDLGETWQNAGKLLTQGNRSDRPYARYWSDGERVDFIVTEQHPRNFNNSIYHGVVKNGQLFNSAGEVVDDNLFDDEAVEASGLTQVFGADTEIDGDAMTRCWTIDIARKDNRTVAIFSARANDEVSDHRFFYATLDNGEWSVHPLARAGGFLYDTERDYTGLAAIDPDDPDRVFISAPIDPSTGEATDHYEIYAGRTDDDGATWDWQAVTRDSTMDNLRPIVPAWSEDRTALLWLRGTYRKYTDYELSVVGLIDPLDGHVDETGH